MIHLAGLVTSSCLYAALASDACARVRNRLDRREPGLWFAAAVMLGATAMVAEQVASGEPANLLIRTVVLLACGCIWGAVRSLNRKPMSGGRLFLGPILWLILDRFAGIDPDPGRSGALFLAAQAVLGIAVLIELPNRTPKHRIAARSESRSAGDDGADVDAAMACAFDRATRTRTDLTFIVVGFADAGDGRSELLDDVVHDALYRPVDRAFRFPGGDIAVLLPDTDLVAADIIVERLRRSPRLRTGSAEVHSPMIGMASMRSTGARTAAELLDGALTARIPLVTVSLPRESRSSRFSTRATPAP